VIASGKPFSPSTTAIRISLTAPSLEIVDDLEPKFRALGLLNPEAEDLFLSMGIEITDAWPSRALSLNDT